MIKQKLLPMFAVAAMLGTSLSASAMPNSMSGHMGMSGHMMMGTGIYHGMKMGPDHGMPEGTQGGDGATYTGKPDLQAAISIVVAGGAPGNFSIVKALTALAGEKTANAEVAKLTKQYGSARIAKYVEVQNFAVNDAVRRALKAGVKFPKPSLTGATLAKRIVGLGLLNGTYYEGYFLDHIVTNGIHEAVMGDIDHTFSRAGDANYHLNLESSALRPCASSRCYQRQVSRLPLDASLSHRCRKTPSHTAMVSFCCYPRTAP
ncbi:MAG: hypothetical protein NVSMB31_15490 [Vulcanimicrobiaceae bacterium]